MTKIYLPHLKRYSPSSTKEFIVLEQVILIHSTIRIVRRKYPTRKNQRKSQKKGLLLTFFWSIRAFFWPKFTIMGLTNKGLLLTIKALFFKYFGRLLWSKEGSFWSNIFDQKGPSFDHKSLPKYLKNKAFVVKRRQFLNTFTKHTISKQRFWNVNHVENILLNFAF